MAGKEVFLTREGYEKLVEKLKYLKTVKRKEISIMIGAARDEGDLKENAGYDAAKDAQAMNEKEIAKIEESLSYARLMEHVDIPKDEALIGATIKLKNLNSGDEIEYTLVSEVEADFSTGKISVSCPVGQALLGHKKGETVEIKVPAGVLKYEVLEIERKM